MSQASKYKRTRAGAAAFQGCPFWGRPLHQALLLALLLSGPGLWPGPPAPGQTSLSAGKAGQRSAPCGPGPLPSISTCLPAPPGPGLSHARLALGSADRSLCPVRPALLLSGPLPHFRKARACSPCGDLGDQACVSGAEHPHLPEHCHPALASLKRGEGRPGAPSARSHTGRGGGAAGPQGVLGGHLDSCFRGVENPSKRMSPVSEQKLSRGRVSFVFSRGGWDTGPSPSSSQGSWLGAECSAILGQNPDPFSSSGGSCLGPEGPGAPSVF